MTSFFFLILSLNFNVRTFRLTQDLQLLTLSLQAIERDVELKELEYYTKTSLDKVYYRATESLNMMRQDRTLVFTKDEMTFR